MTKEKKPLVWIMDKENKYYFSEISVDKNPFRNRLVSLIWVIIYLIITFILYYFTNKKNKYNKYEFKGLIFSIIISICIFAFYYFIDFYKSFTYLDQKQKLYLEEPANNLDITNLVITENNHYFSDKYNKETDFLGIPRETIEKEIKTNKIKAETIIDWTKKDKKKLVSASEKMKPITDKQFENITLHTSRMISILLTLLFLLASTSKKLFKLYRVWIFTIIAIEFSTTIPIWPTTNLQQDRNLLYIIQKIQIVTSCLAITTLIILLESKKFA
jgi:hypothetical protein